VRAENVWKKSSENSAKKVFLYSHEYHDQKMGGIKRAKQFFQKPKNSASKKCWGKNRRKEMRKTFFYFHTNIMTKKWGVKNARNNFSRKTRIVRAKMLGEKSFLYSHEYRELKMGGKTRETILLETQE